MKAALLMGYGSVDMLELGEVDTPVPRADEIQVEVQAASINGIDCRIRRGDLRGMTPIHLPAVLGRDASGTVSRVGRDVSSFKLGDRVMGLVRHGYAELVSAPATAWTKVPEALDIRDAAALPLVTLTGAQLIEEEINVRTGQRVLVTGGRQRRSRGSVRCERARSRRLGGSAWAPARDRE